VSEIFYDTLCGFGTGNKKPMILRRLPIMLNRLGPCRMGRLLRMMDEWLMKMPLSVMGRGNILFN
jgi:hypothetical protein